jgi:hypothetical protein
VGGEGPDELWAAFRVGARAKVQGRRVARGEFEGLVRAPAGWEHRRTLRFVPGKSLTVRDEVRNGRGQVRSHIPLAPGCALDANGALSFGGGKLALRVLHGTRAAEVPGWVGRGFDKREPRQVAAIEAGPDGIVEYSMAMP